MSKAQEGKKINLAGNQGGGFISKVEELHKIKTSKGLKDAMQVPYDPDYILEFQLRDTKGLQNFLKYDDPLFVPGGKTGTGFSEYNMPGLSSKDIINWRVRQLKKGVPAFQR